MARIRTDFVAGALDAALAAGATSMSSPALADLPAIGATEHAAISLFIANSDGRITAKEIVYVTAHTASATTATIARGKEGTTGVAWASGDKWEHSPTVDDFDKLVFLGLPTALTDKLSVSATSTFEQWGTEKATLAQASAPQSVTVQAQLHGFMENVDAGARDADFRIDISLDGGSTWSNGRTTYGKLTAATACPVFAEHGVSGNVTGEIQARAMVRFFAATTGPDFKQGSISLTVA